MIIDAKKVIIICSMNTKYSSSIKKFLRTRYGSLLIVGLSSLIFLLLSFWNIIKPGLWFDEAFSAYIVRFNLFDIAKYTSLDVHPPLYYWFLKLWSLFFGNSELALRSMSVIFGLASLLLAYLLIKTMFGKLPAYFGVFLLSISPMFIRYSDEARMYTMVTAIVLGATYFLIMAVKTNSKKNWTAYGVLVALGMWTHYFSAIVWLSHWFWRYLVTRKDVKSRADFRKSYLSNNWIRAHVVAVSIFALWMPFMIIQLGGIQFSGFWIGPVSINSFTNFLTNTFLYLEFQQVINWQAAGLLAVTLFMILAGKKIYDGLDKQKQSYYLLLVCISLVAPLILFIISLPPLKSSFVERYLLASSVGLILLLAVNLYYFFKVNRYLSLSVFVVSIALIATGVNNVYYYGNYNKNTSTAITTKEVVLEINKKSMAGEPIIADSPWIFYEAVPYSNERNPVYFVDKNTDYKYNSLAMLKDNDYGKIKDLNSFLQNGKVFWYIGYARDDALRAPYENLCEIDKFSVIDGINKRDDYRAVQYRICN